MKIEEVTYLIAGKTLAVLEEKYHYRIPDEHKRDIQRTVQASLNEILKKPHAADAATEAANT